MPKCLTVYFSLGGTTARVGESIAVGLRVAQWKTDLCSISDAGYAVVLWNIDPQDWQRPGAKVIADHLIREAYPGPIILMNDGGGDRTQSVAALETILRQLSQQGYVFRCVYVP